MRNLLLLLTIAILHTSVWAQAGYVQEGKASFYADKFEGRTTASGERYSHSRSTCAHLTLPFGTLVRVTNLSNSKTVVVRVNDRGPFVANRIIDLSRSAAEKLDFINQGIADVKIEAIDEEGKIAQANQTPSSNTAAKPSQAEKVDNSAAQQKEKPEQTVKEPVAKPESKPISPKPEPSIADSPSSNESEMELYELRVTRQKPRGYSVQIGSYKELVNLLHIADDLKSSLKKEVRVQVANVNGDKIYRLMIGDFSSRREANAFKEKAAQVYPDCFVVELK